MKCFKSVPCLPACRLVLLMVVAAISMGIVEIKQAEASAGGVVTPINEVKAVDDNGIPIHTGDIVTIEGIATVGTGVLRCGARHKMIFVQDATGAICVFDFEIRVSVRQGDKVRVTGEVGCFNGLTQLQRPVIKVMSSDNKLPTPQQIDLIALSDFTTAEPLEGQLIKTSIRIARVPTRRLGGAYNIGITDVNRGHQSILRVYPGTGICLKGLKVGTIYTVIGIVGQFDISSPHHGGYQIFPRAQADLKFEKAGEPLVDTVFPATNTVKRVVDGDSIVLEAPVIVHGQEIVHVRLSGIDAPEAWRREDAHHNQRVHGERATEHLRSILPPGTEITLKVCQVKTCIGLGRLLARIKKGNLDVNEAMLHQGYTVTYVVWPNNIGGGRFERLRSAMVEARQAERGIWNPADLLDEIPLKYRKRQFGYALEQYVGDFDTKTYVRFKDMEKVALENRVYFFSYVHVVASGFASGDCQTGGRNVIFIHPDGANAAHFTAARLVHYGPEGKLYWDRLPAVALYKPHILDNLQAGSVAGAVAHASGVKTRFNYYGWGPDGEELTTITEQARAAGFATGLINSGTITEPGTGVFVANVASRRDHTGIALQIARSGVDVILGGGEQYFLPKGTTGRHGEGKREDGKNLIAEMEAKGYAVVYTKEELAAIDPAETERLLGLFAALHTFNARTEEDLKAKGLPHHWEHSPTLATMTSKALSILSKNQKGFLLIIEEEGTDNFANANNAAGTIEALKRADDAIGVAINFAKASPYTLVITAADSDAGGMNIWAPSPDAVARWGNTVPAVTRSGAAADGIGGTKTAPFTTGCGNFQFAIAWAGRGDFASTMIVRAYGWKSELVGGVIDNTAIYHLMAHALGLDRETSSQHPSGQEELMEIRGITRRRFEKNGKLSSNCNISVIQGN